MLDRNLTLTVGALAGAWIEPRLGGEIGAVTLQVPRGFEAYARVFHPARDTEGNSVRWAEVAKELGTTAHREMQWHAIRGLTNADELHRSVGDDVAEPKWDGGAPRLGSMDLADLDALCSILAIHTIDPTQCFFGLCTIAGWEDDFRSKDLDVTRLLELPMGRDHIALAGPLSAVDQIVRDWSKAGPSSGTLVFYSSEGPPPKPDPARLRSREAPNLIWPTDRSWLVCSEVDFDSTLVGGSTALIEAIVRSADLETWQVEPDTSLAVDADKINAAPESGT